MAIVDPAAAARAKAAASVNLMTPGPGTPWEDRDSLGVVGAFVKTCIRSMTGPTALTDQIRRLSDRSDSKLFAIGCGIMWFISTLVHQAISYWKLSHTANIRVDNVVLFWLRAGLGGAVIGAGVVVALTFATKVYYGMVSGEDMKGRGSADLVYNVLAYCLGPSILAPIPYVGPIAALAIILVVIIQC